MCPELQLHHIGIVVPEIEPRRQFYVDVLGYQEQTAIIHDPVQTAYVQFFSMPNGGHYLELVAPDSEVSKLANASRKGQPLSHLCYSCDNIEAAIHHLNKSGCFTLQEPVPATAFDGRRIAWLMSKTGLLMELVERGPEGSL